jgi:hypothetical protein
VDVIVIVIVFGGLVRLRILPAVCIEKREGLPLSLGLWWFSSGSQLKDMD